MSKQCRRFKHHITRPLNQKTNNITLIVQGYFRIASSSNQVSLLLRLLRTSSTPATSSSSFSSPNRLLNPQNRSQTQQLQIMPQLNHPINPAHLRSTKPLLVCDVDSEHSSLIDTVDELEVFRSPPGTSEGLVVCSAKTNLSAKKPENGTRTVDDLPLPHKLPPLEIKRIILIRKRPTRHFAPSILWRAVGVS